MNTQFSMPVRIVNGNEPGGPAILDENGKLPASVLPGGGGDSKIVFMTPIETQVVEDDVTVDTLQLPIKQKELLDTIHDTLYILFNVVEFETDIMTLDSVVKYEGDYVSYEFKFNNGAYVYTSQNDDDYPIFMLP